VEDAFSTNEYNKNDKKHIKTIRFLKSKLSCPIKGTLSPVPLALLHSHLIKNNINSINVENRHIQMLFSHWDAYLLRLPKSSPIDEVQQNINRIKSYKEKLAIPTQKRAKVIIQKIEEYTLKNYISTESIPLLDFEFIHNILLNQNKKRIYVFAGFLHTLEIEKILIQDMGYKKDPSSSQNAFPCNCRKKDINQFNLLNLNLNTGCLIECSPEDFSIQEDLEYHNIHDKKQRIEKEIENKKNERAKKMKEELIRKRKLEEENEKKIRMQDPLYRKKLEELKRLRKKMREEKRRNINNK